MLGNKKTSSTTEENLLARPVGAHTTTRPLGSSGLDVTILGQGGSSLGDLYVKLNNSQALDTLLAAHARGINFYDTSPWYGLGLSEARFGIALHALPRKSFVLQTKVFTTERVELSIATGV